LLRIVVDLCIDGFPGHLTASADATPTSPINSKQAKREQIVDAMTPPTPAVTWKPRPLARVVNFDGVALAIGPGGR
jgi:hypothetical protein